MLEHSHIVIRYAFFRFDFGAPGSGSGQIHALQSNRPSFVIKRTREKWKTVKFDHVRYFSNADERTLSLGF